MVLPGLLCLLVTSDTMVGIPWLRCPPRCGEVILPACKVISLVQGVELGAVVCFYGTPYSGERPPLSGQCIAEPSLR
jgi:hypothetical protein